MNPDIASAFRLAVQELCLRSQNACDEARREEPIDERHATESLQELWAIVDHLQMQLPIWVASGYAAAAIEVLVRIEQDAEDIAAATNNPRIHGHVASVVAHIDAAQQKINRKLCRGPI